MAVRSDVLCSVVGAAGETVLCSPPAFESQLLITLTLSDVSGGGGAATLYYVDPDGHPRVAAWTGVIPDSGTVDCPVLFLPSGATLILYPLDGTMDAYGSGWRITS